MSDLHIKVGGAWKAIDDAFVKVGGAWKSVSKVYVKVAGAWKEVWVKGVVTLTGATISDLSTSNALVYINTDGTVDKAEPGRVQISASTDWIIPNASANSLYEVSWTLVSGDAPSGTNMAVEGTWYPLTVDRYVGYQPPVSTYETGVIRVAIRYNGGATLDTGDYDIEAFEVP